MAMAIKNVISVLPAMFIRSSAVSKKEKHSSRKNTVQCSSDMMAAIFRKPLHSMAFTDGMRLSSSRSEGKNTRSIHGAAKPANVIAPAATPGVPAKRSMRKPSTKPSSTYNHRGVSAERISRK